MRSVAVLIALAASAVTAQVQNYTSSLDMRVDPNEVAQQQRAVWCQAQTNSCQQLCNTNTNDNSCNQATLEYSCTCSKNSSAPALQYYIQTMPTFICQQVFSDCITANAGNAKGQADCKSHIEKLCGTAKPPLASDDSDDDDSSSSTTSASATKATAPPTSAAHSATAANAAPTSQTSTSLAGPALAPGGAGAVAVAAAGLFTFLL
ncbi:hypothetical protein ESCO_006083 [Escovopsis weberi]|uniref:DUF7707 domain-containing protein n=1 Tax=Escovopsis weberi TaxID=150374 RepID=A0A0M8MVK3_ESCWE|nr:hypothetical protein ESCO_006083 [Escovopsis weberi]